MHESISKFINSNLPDLYSCIGITHAEANVTMHVTISYKYIIFILYTTTQPPNYYNKSGPSTYRTVAQFRIFKKKIFKKKRSLLAFTFITFLRHLVLYCIRLCYRCTVAAASYGSESSADSVSVCLSNLTLTMAFRYQQVYYQHPL